MRGVQYEGLIIARCQGMYAVVKAKQLAIAIDLIAKKIPGGISAILGKRAAPTYDELRLALWKPRTGENIKVSHDSNPDRVADEAITQVLIWGVLDDVRWAAINKAAQYYCEFPMFKRDWQIYAEYARLCELPRSYGTGALMDILAEKYDTTPQTIYRILKRVPYSIALLALNNSVS